jgi:hypothetical protein
MNPMSKSRAELMEERRKANHEMDFCPIRASCPRCGCDLVAYYGDKFPTETITGCPKCHRSYCD